MVIKEEKLMRSYGLSGDGNYTATDVVALQRRVLKSNHKQATNAIKKERTELCFRKRYLLPYRRRKEESSSNLLF